MDKTCAECRSRFEVTPDDLAFYEKVSPVFAGKQYLVPPPKLCPDCRQQRRLALCNERHFYSGQCGICKQSILVEQPPQNEMISLCRACYHGDTWDPCAYGRAVDFSRPIFEQMSELRRAVPTQNLMSEGTNENCDYIHYAGFAKNCYLIMHADFCEDCYYGYGFKKNTSCVDGFYNLSCELCYDCVDVHKSYGLTACQDCNNCSSSAFLRDCIGCKSCFLCVGLREKEYCFENQQLSRADYEARIAKLDLGSYRTYQACRERLANLEREHCFKEYHGYNLESCSGDYIANCKDTHKSFDCEDVEGGKFLYQVVTGAKNDYDIYQYGLNLSESYECSVAGNNCYHILLSHSIHVNSNDLLYCWRIEACKNCFGCVCMNHKEYCILNKQYTREEYEKLVPKIIEHMIQTGEWGELFPISFSPFGYNKTNAQHYYPMEKEAVLAKGWKWDDYTPPVRDVKGTIEADALLDLIDDAPANLSESAIRCEVTGRLFRITQPELKFYRNQRLPIPRRSPDQRHLDRFARRNPRRFWDRPCGSCGKEISTTYDPARPERVYCEGCYLRETY